MGLQPCVIHPRQHGLGPFNGDGVNHHVLYRPVLSAFFYLGNLIGHVLAFHYFTEYRVIAREPRRGCDSDKKLAAICSGTSIRHGQLACFIEFVRRAFGFVSEFIARASHAGAAGVASLDHKIRDHPMKDGAAVKWAVAAFAAYAVFPATFAFGKVGKVLCGYRRFLFKKSANNLAFSSIKNRICAWLACHELFLSMKFWMLLEYPAYFFGAGVALVPVAFFVAGFEAAPAP